MNLVLFKEPRGLDVEKTSKFIFMQNQLRQIKMLIQHFSSIPNVLLDYTHNHRMYLVITAVVHDMLQMCVSHHSMLAFLHTM